jgi:hypothetical protein
MMVEGSYPKKNIPYSRRAGNIRFSAQIAML